MKLKECVTCGSHEFNGNKCAYCGNVYELEEKSQATEEELDFPEMDEVEFKDTPVGKKTLKAMIWLLVAIIWFAITVFIPPLFLLTICGLIILACKWLIKKGENK